MKGLKFTKHPYILSLITLIAFCCQQSEDPSPQNCFGGLEVITNNPGAEVYTENMDGEGYLIIRIEDPQAEDDVILRYTDTGFTNDRAYYLQFSAEQIHAETEEPDVSGPTAAVSYVNISYDFDVDTPIINIKNGGDTNNIIAPGFTQGATNTSTHGGKGFRVMLDGTEADITAGTFNRPFTWDGFQLPDPIVTSISFGVSPRLEEQYDTQLLEYRISFINKETGGIPERDIQFNFDCE